MHLLLQATAVARHTPDRTLTLYKLQPEFSLQKNTGGGGQLTTLPSAMAEGTRGLLSGPMKPPLRSGNVVEYGSHAAQMKRSVRIVYALSIAQGAHRP